MSSWRDKIHEIIFEADTPSGKFFDVLLLVSIMASVLVVMLDSIAEVKRDYGSILYTLEWIFTILFTIEYVLRVISVRKPWYYIRSFYGVIDVLAIIPTYLSAILPGTQFLLTIRMLRMLRVFRVLKFVQYINEAAMLGEALQASRRKITVFLFAVVTIVVILGSVQSVVAGSAHQSHRCSQK